MIIYSPLYRGRIGQRFGESRACARVNRHGQPYWPYQIKSKRNGTQCPSGYKDFYHLIGLKAHNGDDWPTYYKQRIYFDVLGVGEWYVYRAETNPDIGIGLEVVSRKRQYIEHLPKEATKEVRDEWERNNGYLYVKHVFWHAQSNAVNEGDTVEAGQLIQFSNSTGASSGNHLHRSTKFCDEHGNTVGKDNGYNGAVDVREIMYEDTFILDALGKTEDLTPSQILEREAQFVVGRTRQALLAVANIVRAFVGGLTKAI